MLLHCNISTTSVAFLQRAATMRALHVAIAFLSMRLSVCLSVCPSYAGIMSKRMNIK